jgi:PAS domain S-box-containing protein
MHNQSTQAKRNMKGLSAAIFAVLLLCFIAVSLWLIVEYADKERQRDLQNWQSRLALLAEIRAESVESWVSLQQAQLSELADNPSLRLFLTEYDSASADASVLAAQQAHVRNLLHVSAQRFSLVNSQPAQSLNLQRKTPFGLALLNSDGQLMMASKGFDFAVEQHSEIVQQTLKNARPQIIDFHKAGQSAVLGFIAPVFRIQDLESSTPVGLVLVMLNPAKDLYPLLENRQSATTTDETLLVRQQGPALVYISPIRHERRLFHQLPDNNNLLAASMAFHNPGAFVRMMDYSGEPVLMTGRKLNQTPWGLIQKINAREALAESNRHQQFLLTTFSVLILFLAAAFIAVWRHGTSLRLQQISEALENRTALLNAVTDNIREHIFLLDQEDRIVFANPSFAALYELQVSELIGKHLPSIIGVEQAQQLKSITQKTAANAQLKLTNTKQNNVYHVSVKQLSSGEHQGEVLYVLHDITQLKQEQEKREQLGQGIINTLVKAVDMHDPYCANHSQRTREVALEIGRALELSEAQLESLQIASLLANIGKLMLPREILTKLQPLSEEEAAQLRKHIDYSVEILSDLSFNGPVLDIIEQKNERMDGSGYPKGLSGDDILLESRVLAVANAFVAMVSSRAYREGRSVDEVTDILLQQSGSLYDRHVVAALFHIAENQSNWSSWQQVQTPQS